jgi:Type IV pilin-like G and H, putative
MRQFIVFASFSAIALTLVSCTPTKTPETQSRAPIELGARDAVNSILFDQKTYFMENDAFTASVKSLNSSDLTETQSYKYKLTPKPNAERGMIITATSKQPTLKSFTGVVFAVESNKGPVTISQICETVNPSKVAPVAPSIPKQASDKLRCPAGSRSTLDILAMQ